ncbi:MAG: cobalamin B12-binding domain-containing protein [Acidobacteria bacterium]|nr:cobalamin B12-binding domain-containing protein [Acidobacteriota bacterium]
MGAARNARTRVLLIHDDEVHTRGYFVVARALRGAGMEVVLGGPATPAQAAATAAQEDVGLIGYHIMSGAPVILVERLLAALDRSGPVVPVVVGGIVPPEDLARLESLGVAAVFLPGAPLRSIIEGLCDLVVRTLVVRELER